MDAFQFDDKRSSHKADFYTHLRGLAKEYERLLEAQGSKVSGCTHESSIQSKMHPGQELTKIMISSATDSTASSNGHLQASAHNGQSSTKLVRLNKLSTLRGDSNDDPAVYESHCIKAAYSSEKSDPEQSHQNSQGSPTALPVQLLRSGSSSANSSFARFHAQCHKFQVRPQWRDDMKVSVAPMTYSKTSALNRALNRQSSMGPILVHDSSRCAPFIIRPGSVRRLCWDLLSMLFLVYDTVTIPYVLSFEPVETEGLRVMTWVTIIFWTVDIFITFMTGYQTRKKIVLEPKAIARHYLRFYFWWDLAIVTIDWVLLAMDDLRSQGSTARIGRTLRVLKLLKTMRLVRTVKIRKIVQAIQDEISSESVSIWFGILQVVMALLFVNHWVACGWYAIGQVECDCLREGWVENQKMRDFSLAYRYATSLHWSLAQFTPAPNEIFASNIYERVFSLFVLVLALVGFSAFVSTVTAGVVQLRHLRNKESHQFWQLRRYLRDWHVRPIFRKRLISYLEHAFERTQRRVQEQDVVLLQLLSDPLRDDLRHETLQTHLLGHPLFSKSCQYARIISASLKCEFFGVNDMVFNCGDEASRMVFVGHGRAEYIMGQLSGMLLEETDSIGSAGCSAGGAHADYLEVGRWVAEAALWIEEWVHLGDLVCMEETQVVTIDAKKFAGLVRTNKPFWRGVSSYAKEFSNLLNKMDRPRLSDLMLGDISPSSLIKRVEFPRGASTFGDVLGSDQFIMRACLGLFTKFTSFSRKDSTKSHGVVVSRSMEPVITTSTRQVSKSMDFIERAVDDSADRDIVL